MIFSVVLRIIGSAIVVGVILVLGILSAIPYGGGGEFLSLLKPTVPLLCIWIGYPFVMYFATPAGKGRALASFVALLAVAWWFAFGQPHWATDRRMALREEAVALCRSQPAGTPEDYKVDGILDGAGALHGEELLSLLTTRGIRSVALGPGLGSSSPGVFNGSERHVLRVPDGAQYVKLELVDRDDRRCAPDAASRLGLYFEGPPFTPRTCLATTPSVANPVSHVLRSEPLAGHRGMIRWSLVEQASGRVRVGIASGDEPGPPMRQDSRDEADWKSVGDKGRINCRSPYSSMLQTLWGPFTPSPALLLSRRPVPASVPFEGAAAPDLRFRQEKPELSNREWSDIVNGPSWTEAYEQAARTGWGNYRGALVRPVSGELIELGVLDRSVPRQVLALADGFIEVQAIARYTNVRVIRYDLEGRALWHGVMKHPPPGPDELVRFDPMALAVRDGDLVVYGFKRFGQPQKTEVYVWRTALR
ncbi:hypothetical protein DSM104443_01667 [Usitatibacter rugosus]|uniref:Uncharacterized protein n=2 Tax=Usitatibacter rugosus TaxID=2732067 RepID=A0A6M4GW78_9PROT|nr:hypothetical protein DSM104443_01667 [Usitatibacter rugosus]